MHKPILKSAIFNSVATTTYIAIIASSAYYTGKHNVGQTDTVFIPIFMLMLFVFSAALTGSLMLGKPILWYLEGKKKEALLLFSYTFGSFFLLTAIVLIFLIIFSR